MAECKTQSIVPHRSYRKLKVNKPLFMTEILLYMLFSLAAVYFYVTYLFNGFTNYFYERLKDANIDASLSVVNIYGFDLKMIDLPFIHTQPFLLFLILVAMILLFFILKKQRILPYNIAMWLNFFVLIFIVFVLYFIFAAESFPYSFIQYFELYHTAHIGLMLFSFFITILAVVLTPATYGMKAVTVVVMVVYYMVYSLIRYAFTVLLASQVSIVMAPIMFFTLYLDFIFFVSIYSYFLYKSAVRFQRKDQEWKW